MPQGSTHAWPGHGADTRYPSQVLRDAPAEAPLMWQLFLAAHCQYRQWVQTRQEKGLHLDMQPVVLQQRLQQLPAQLLIEEHHPRAAGDGLAQVQPGAGALARQGDEVLQALPLEAAAAEEYLHACARTSLSAAARHGPQCICCGACGGEHVTRTHLQGHDREGPARSSTTHAPSNLCFQF